MDYRTPSHLRQAAAAFVFVKETGHLNDLQDRLTTEWHADRERRNNRTIGGEASLASELKRYLKLTADDASEAASQHFARSHQQVAVDALIQFAKEIYSSQNSYRRPA